MAEEPCPLCGSGAPKLGLGAWKDYQWLDCPDCGLASARPFRNPGPEFYAQFSDLYPHEAQEETDPMDPEYDECLAALGAGGGRRLLDVGCGGGGFLKRAKEAGFEAWGLDFNEARLKLVGARLGLETLYQGSLPDFAAKHPEGRFDVITLFQVLEHLDNPGQWLASARALLRPGGRLFLGTPNRDRTFEPFSGPGMEEIDNPPNHLTRWRAEAMRGFVERHGFKVLEVKPLGVPLPLLALLLRNTLRLGLATKALNVDQLQHAVPANQAGPASLKTRLVQAAVKVKEFAINTLAVVIYPLFRLGFAVFGWQGVVLYCVAEPKEA